MADLDTMHRIVEKLEVTGEKDASKKINKVAEMADKLAEALGFSTKEGKGVTDVLDDVSNGAKKTTGGFIKMVAGLAIVSEAVGWVIQKFKMLLTLWWDVNKGTEAMMGRIQGVSLGLLKFTNENTKIATSLKLTNILMAEFRDHAIRIGVDLPELEGSYTRINSVMSSMGKSQFDVLQTTKMTASAAKVYGENLEMAGSIISKALIEGTVEGESAFAKAFKSQVGAMPGRGFNKLPIEKRAKKIEQVLKEMAAPIDVIATDTESALMRWKVLSEDVLQRVTYPLYKKIGGIVTDIVGYLEKNKSTMDAIVDKTTHWFGIIWDLGATIFDISARFAKFIFLTDMFKQAWKNVAATGNIFFKVVGAIGHGLRTLAELAAVVVDKKRGLGKLEALGEGIKLKFVEVLKAVKDLFAGIFKLVGGHGYDKVFKKTPVLGKYYKALSDNIRSASTSLDETIAKWEKNVARLEKKAGMSPTTEFGQRQEMEAMGLGMDKDARLAWLKKLFGKKRPLINVQNMNVHQDFRDVDPDNVMVEMVRLYESLAEEAISSNVGGEESVFSGAS